MTDNEAMQYALMQAKLAYQKKEVPIGAVLVIGGKIIASAHNEVESLQEASAHAEMLCLRRAAQNIGNWRLIGATLYCTLEPCTMCAGALFLYRVDRVVWGAKDIRQGAHGSWVDLTCLHHPIHKVKSEGGLLAEESSLLVKSFFQEKRGLNP